MVKKSKVCLNGNVEPTKDKKPTSTEILVYQQLTEDQYTAGLVFAKSKKMGLEYGYREQEGFYLRLFPDNRTDALVDQFEAALG